MAVKPPGTLAWALPMTAEAEKVFGVWAEGWAEGRFWGTEKLEPGLWAGSASAPSRVATGWGKGAGEGWGAGTGAGWGTGEGAGAGWGLGWGCGAGAGAGEGAGGGGVGFGCCNNGWAPKVLATV